MTTNFNHMRSAFITEGPTLEEPDLNQHETADSEKVKRPSFQFYPADWRKDSALRLCSIAARGLWIEMICIAHECEEYGKLKHGGKVFDHKRIAKLVGLSSQTCRKLLEELEENKVFYRDKDGAIFSKRMIHDEHIRNTRAKSGSMGGNPNLVNQNVKQNPTPSSSSSSSSSFSSKKEEKEIEFPTNLQTIPFRKAWSDYLTYRKNARMRSLPPVSIESQLNRLSGWGHDTAIRAIEETIANGWQGIFEPETSPARTFNKPFVKPRAASCL
jgi:hypothetical protein